MIEFRLSWEAPCFPRIRRVEAEHGPNVWRWKPWDDLDLCWHPRASSMLFTDDAADTSCATEHADRLRRFADERTAPIRNIRLERRDLVATAWEDA